MKRDSRFKKIVYAMLALALATAAILSVPLYRKITRAHKALETGWNRLQERNQVAVVERDFTPGINSKARLWLGPERVRDAVEFQGAVYAATNAGLAVYSPEGRLLQRWTPAEGFPSLDLTSLAVHGDSLWVGSADAGLLRLRDGAWKQYLPKDSGIRPVHALLASRQGALFVGTGAGVLRYDGSRFEHFYADKLRKAIVTAFAGDAYSLWIGTYNSGLFLFEKGALKSFGAEQGLSDTLVTDMEADGAGILVATPAGIQRLENGAFEYLLKNTFVQSLCRWEDEVWAATQDHGLVRVPVRPALRRPGGAAAPALPETGRAVPLLRRLGNSMVAFAQGKAWRMGEGSRWKPWLDAGSPLTDGNISSLLRAANGDLWVGYFDRGVDILNADFQRKAHMQDDVFFCINYLSQDGAGNVYVSTANGLAVIHPDGSRRVYRTADGLLSDRVMQAVPLDQGGKRVAIATAQGFTLLEGGALKSLYAFHGLVNNHVYSIAADGDQIYLGTLGGISRIRNMQVVSNWTQMDSGLRRNWVNALLAIDNKLLVGTYGSGIQERAESGDWSGFSPLPEDFEVNPNAFFFDGRFVFCGTLDRGAYIYDTRNNTWKQLRSHLPGPNVTAFARAGGFLLVATDRGLLQVSYDEISTTPDLR